MAYPPTIAELHCVRTQDPLAEGQAAKHRWTLVLEPVDASKPTIGVTRIIIEAEGPAGPSFDNGAAVAAHLTRLILPGLQQLAEGQPPAER